MQKGDHKGLGELIYASHFSLQNDYKVSCAELDFLVQETINKEFILGSRMMGGGFGGCTINIIELSKVDAFVEEVSESYRNEFGIDLTKYSVSIEDGTHAVS
jgi:galactokinase